MPKLCNLEFAVFDGIGKYNIPEIKPVYDCELNNWLGFNYLKSWGTKADKDIGVHFFLHDYQFERVWNTPDKYLTYLSKYGCVLSPDFSMFLDMPLAVSIYNHYRKHWLAAYWQYMGITVIPTISWLYPDSYDWCFDGEPKNSVVAVSDVGCRKASESREVFEQGYQEMLNRLNPSKILFYTRTFEHEHEGNVKYIRMGRGLVETEGDK